jgi:P27 family predicted phage terminase small subunit
VPEPAAWFDEAALAAWWHVVGELKAMGLLARSDRHALIRYCEMWSQWQIASGFVREKGQVYPIRNKDGQVTCMAQFPQVSIARTLAAELRRLEQEFGLTPSARARIVLPEAAKGDGMEGALFG